MAAAAVAIVAGTVAAIRFQNRCEPSLTEGYSTARHWNEQALDAIRRDFPAPTVHARNLYHLSAALWDVWAATAPPATVEPLYGFTTWEGATQGDQVQRDRAEAMGYAAHRLLSERYVNAVGGAESLAAFDAALIEQCLSVATAKETVPARPPGPGTATPETSDPATLGISIAIEVLAATRDDGANEASNYVDLSYSSVNLPLIVSEPGTTMADPNRWQPLSLAQQITQNGQAQPSGVQEFVGAQWGFVTPFAITGDPEKGLPIDPGMPPRLGDGIYEAEALEVVKLAGSLDPADGALIDLSPRRLGHEVNPATGQPYAEVVVPSADYGRVIAEYWADGPESETPPGHWNTLANYVGDTMVERGMPLRLGGSAPEISRLEWDVKVYLALNGAMHDSAVAAWGAKRYFDFVRPISIVRYLGQRGELPLEPDVSELITQESSLAGNRHEGLWEFVGQNAIRVWRGQPEVYQKEVSGVGWVAAAEWVPYQRSSFVTPSFAAYVSGHSAFSRAGAEVLEAATGDGYFPGGLATHQVEPGNLLHEFGPSVPVTLQWATYRDAADEAGRSRIYGGIHISADDLAGRAMGAMVGQAAWQRAEKLFNG